MVVAVVVDAAVLSALIVVATTCVSIFLVRTVRAADVRTALRGAVIVSASVIVVGIPAVAVLTATAASGTETTSDAGAPEAAGSADLSAALARSLDRADEIAPDGAQSILSISIDQDRETLYVLNQRNGQMVYTYRSGDEGWHAPTSSPTSQRTVFSRADVRGLDLTAAGRLAAQTWRRLDQRQDVVQPTVEVAPRSGDEKLVATFAGGAFPIEPDATGRLAETADAASVDRFLDVAERVMTETGLDSRAPLLREIAFKSIDDGASWHGRARAGFDLSFDGGPVTSIAVDVGRFPMVRKATRDDEPDGFSLTGLTGATMTSVRDDLARRGTIRRYDRDVIGAKIGVARDDDRPGRVPVTIQMVVGPSAVEVAGVYSTRGRFLRDGVE